MTEQWRAIPGYEGLYEVSDLGRIRTTRRKGSAGGLLRLITNRNSYGYPSIGLYRDAHGETRYVHALVMEAFVGPRPPGMEVRHLDGDGGNCSLSNLAYGLPSENAWDRVRHGTHNMASKTHCKRGHPFDPANTHVYQGRRTCRTCNNERNRAKRRELRLAS